MKQELKLDFLFPSLNEYISAMNRNRHIGNDMKGSFTTDVLMNCKNQKIKPYTSAVQLKFIYREKRANRDPDNIVFAKKFILDGMVNAGVIPNDTQRYIKKFTDEWVVDRENPGVLVIIEEWTDDRRTSPLDGNSTN